MRRNQVTTAPSKRSPVWTTDDEERQPIQLAAASFSSSREICFPATRVDQNSLSWYMDVQSTGGAAGAIDSHGSRSEAAVIAPAQFEHLHADLPSPTRPRIPRVPRIPFNHLRQLAAVELASLHMKRPLFNVIVTTRVSLSRLSLLCSSPTRKVCKGSHRRNPSLLCRSRAVTAAIHVVCPMTIGTVDSAGQSMLVDGVVVLGLKFVKFRRDGM